MEVLSWQSSGDTWRNSALCHRFFHCFENEGMFITGHFNWLELPGTHVFICSLSEMLTFMFHFTTQIIQFLQSSGGSAIFLNLLLKAA